MNSCAVRTIQDYVNQMYFTDVTLNSVISLPRMPRALSHEPKSERRFALNLISLDEKHLTASVGTYAECRHCNCIYSIED